MKNAIARIVTDDIRQMTDEAERVLAIVVPFAERVGAAMSAFQELVELAEDGELINIDPNVDSLREETGYDRLMDVCWRIAGHAMAAADHTEGGTTTPAWYDALLAQRERSVKA